MRPMYIGIGLFICFLVFIFGVVGYHIIFSLEEKVFEFDDTIIDVDCRDGYNYWVVFQNNGRKLFQGEDDDLYNYQGQDVHIKFKQRANRAFECYKIISIKLKGGE